MNRWKSIGAVAAGFLTVVLLSVGTDVVLEKVGFFPDPSGGLFDTTLLIIALAYRSLYTVAGGYVTAWAAPVNRMKHVKILAVIGTIAGTAGVVAGWDLSQHWYPIALAVTAFPLTWLGGVLRSRITTQ